MPDLKPWSALPVGGTVVRDEAVQPETGGWRTGLKPQADLNACELPPLLALLSRLGGRAQGTTFVGLTSATAGCEICAEICPVNAIEMVADEN
jgi:ferredoxin